MTRKIQMPKRIDYAAELVDLQKEPDDAFRPVTLRASVKCLRQLYRICIRDRVNLSSLTRQILEEQAGRYLEENRRPSESSTGLLLQVTPETRKLLETIGQGLALSDSMLLTLIVTEAIPAWLKKAGQAAQQRREALVRLENQD